MNQKNWTAGERRKFARNMEFNRSARKIGVVGFLFSRAIMPVLLVLGLSAASAYAMTHQVSDSISFASTAPVISTPGIAPMDVKAVTDQLAGLDTKIQAFIAKAEDEIKNVGKVSTETKGELTNLATKGAELAQRMLNVEQKLTAPRGDDPKLVKSIGELFTESEEYKAMLARGGSIMKSDPYRISGLLHKTALVNATGQNQPLVPAFRAPGIVTPADQPLTIRDVVPSMPISSNLFEWVKESSYSSAAAPQGAGSSPQVYENVAKAEAAIAFTMDSTPVRTIAHWIPVSNQLLSDAPALQAYINVRLMYGLKLEEEDQFVNGDGTGANLGGLLKSGNFTAYDASDDAVGNNRADTLRHAIKQARVNSFYRADTIVMNPADWEKVELTKQSGTGISSGQYIFTSPANLLAPSLWGRRVVECDSLEQGKFIVGAFAQAAMILDREGASVAVSREHASFFIQNMTAILVEERVGFVVTRPAAIIYGEFPQDDDEDVMTA